MAKVRIRDLLSVLKRKAAGSPAGMQPPYLHAMLDNAAWALVRPGAYTDVYVTNLRIDLAEARRVICAIEQVIPTLDKRSSEKWEKRRGTSEYRAGRVEKGRKGMEAPC